MYASASVQRWMVWLTLGLIAVYSVGYLMIGFYPPPAPTLSATEIVALYSEHNMQTRIGVVLCLVSGAFLLPWSVVVSMQMARLEKGMPGLAILQFGAGIVGTIFLWGPPILWGAAAFTVERDPALTLAIHEVSWLCFITPLCAFPMQLMSVGVISLTKKENDKYSAFPRWIGYLTIWQAVQSLGGLAAQLFKTGVFAWNGLFPFYIPIVLYGVWTIALAWTLLRAITYQQSIGEA